MEGSGHKFHIVSCLIRRISNGFQIFRLWCISSTPINVQWPNQLDWRSPRCHERTHDAKFVAMGHKFHVTSSLTGRIPNGFHVCCFHCNYLTPIDLPQTYQLDWRSPRCPERTHDAKSVCRGPNFMSRAPSLDGFPMDLKFFTFNASLKPKLMCTDPIV